MEWHLSQNHCLSQIADCHGTYSFLLLSLKLTDCLFLSLIQMFWIFNVNTATSVLLLEVTMYRRSCWLHPPFVLVPSLVAYRH